MSTPPDASSKALPALAPPPAHVIQRHIVQQDELGTGIQRLLQFIQVFHFNLQRNAGRDDAEGLFQRLADATGSHDVVFLDQDAVVQADALIVAAAHGHRVFLRQAQAGQGLAGVQDAGAGTSYHIHITAGLGGNG
jgi:hypothetical protein